jgi:hypothetical protein
MIFRVNFYLELLNGTISIYYKNNVLPSEDVNVLLSSNNQFDFLTHKNKIYKKIAIALHDPKY